MGWAAIFSAVAKGITNAYSTYNYIKENKEQAKQIAAQAQEQADARARKATTLMNQQKTSFLKGGVYFDSGTPVDIIEETYDTAMDDIEAINRDSLTAQKKLIRAGRTAFINFMINPAENNGGEIASSLYSQFSSNDNSFSFGSQFGGTKMSGFANTTQGIA